MRGSGVQRAVLRELIQLFPFGGEWEENVRKLLECVLHVPGVLGLLYVKEGQTIGAGEPPLTFPSGVFPRRGKIDAVRFRSIPVAPDTYLVVFWKGYGWVFPPLLLSLFVSLLRFLEHLEHERRQRFFLLNGSTDFLFFLDSEGRILEANARVEDVLGWKRENTVGRRIAEFIGEEAWWVLRNNGMRMELALHTLAGRLLHVEAILTPLESAKLFLLALRDIGERKRYEAVLLRFALYDQLTEVYNRRFLEEYLRKELERARREGYPLTLVMLDIDAFKAINDRYGHVFGDEVLRMVARMLQESLRSSDVVARYGGDEFILVLPRAKEEDAHKVMERVSKNLKGAQVMGE
ncbi:MAG: sensor domain-containing diguanylate cyclase, partial [Candidatus Caldatribacterium sp.]|nr:sensor domain-containing diguanylate cyclase [Candidatus Caldatribacterium sp.]